MKTIFMKGIFSTGILVAMLLIAMSCNNNDHAGIGPEPGSGRLVDQGEIPVRVQGHFEFPDNEFQTAAMENNFVFVATSDGLWKHNLSTKEWSRSGLAGKRVSCIFKHPTIKNKLFAGIMPDQESNEKSFFISNDGGATWNAAQTPVYDALHKRYETYVSIAVRPNHPDQIYANLSGTMIAVSTDGGNVWKQMNYEENSAFGYRSNIVFLPDHPGQIFQGSENPFDDAWLGRYDIDAKDPVLLTNFTKVVASDVYGNRRPVELLTTSYTGNSIYVGQEGALSKVTGTTTKFIFKAEENDPKIPYAYIYGIWVDPKNTNHILFGGAPNGNQTSLNLFETFDEGQAIRQLNGSPALNGLQIVKIVATEKAPAVIAYDPATEKITLFLYQSE